MTDNAIPEMPLVSVITPSFNQGRFIEETIKSVAEQDYPRIEHIVVDGGSSDESLSIIKRYSDRLTWVSEKDRGQADAINKGFMMAKGDILCWLNSDDTYEPGAISTAVNYLLENNDVAMVYGEGNEIDEEGHLIQRFPATQQFDLWTLVNIWDYILQPTVFFRRSVFASVGMLDLSLNWCLDWDLWIRIGSHFKVEHIDYVFANSRIYPQTKTGSGGFKRFREIVSIMRKYGRRRYPLGYFIFLEDTIENLLSRSIPFLYKVLRRPLTWWRIKADKKRATYQGVYGDSWLGKRAFFMLRSPENTDRIVWDMEFPQEASLYPNTLKIKINGKKSAKYRIDGPGRLSAAVENLEPRAGPVEARLCFSKAFVPMNERRKMVCYLHAMTEG